ncbi:UDP-N-acetylglucosamine transporter ROCK1 [Malania oleifera]|uniref:UDP-N-acetylglucosamine transporter ROCK1 n=1 Tax=Malania oleifera TaxID=397392 RepID=UPI0025ADBF55|nr:UDP-N-acetylglucosamine transporter ROCK1 [Malania oleifera]
MVTFTVSSQFEENTCFNAKSQPSKPKVGGGKESPERRVDDDDQSPKRLSRRSPLMAARTTKVKGPASTPGRTTARVWLYLALLTLQYGAQPLISKRFTGPKVIVTSSVLACEVAKVICAVFLITKDGSLKKLYKEWTLVGSLTASGLPAAIYAVQNSLLQISYKNLDSLTFSILNQTKLFFTALFTYIILRQKQSVQQIGALFLLIIAAILLSIGEGSSKGSSDGNPDQILFYGIVPVLVASVLSGLASALCQWASQVKKHTSYLMTVEMSIVGSLCLMASMYKSPDGEAIRRHGFFYGWTPLTLIPIISNALGGILVGLVTTYAGGVRKGFVIVSALLVTALLQFIFDGKPPSFYCLVALPIVTSSISVYQKYPYQVKKKEA